jgi:hypothetical protein
MRGSAPCSREHNGSAGHEAQRAQSIERPRGRGEEGRDHRACPHRHQILTASITNESADDLSLAPGKTAYAVIKASSVMVAVD